MRNIRQFIYSSLLILAILCHILVNSSEKSSALDFAPAINSEKLAKISEISENPAKSTSLATTFSTKIVVNKTLRFTVARTVDNPAVDAGSSVLRYRSLLYAHSTRAFNPIKPLQPGDTFEVLENGNLSTYRVSVRRVYSRDVELNGAKNSSYRNKLYSAIYPETGHQYDVVLMTCGNGYNDDSSYRLVLYAERIS